MRFRMLFGMCAGLLCNVYAQDQVEVFNGPFTELTTGVPANPRQISLAEARALVEATLQARDHPTPNYVDDPKFYCGAPQDSPGQLAGGANHPSGCAPGERWA